MTPTLTYALVAALAGALIGSFLNVVIYRLPRGESLLWPSSHCTACGTAVKPYDNVPVLAWLWLHGHCRTCSLRISVRYPIVEAGTAVLCAAVVGTRFSAAGLALGLLLVLIVVPIALIDLEHHVIPNKITLPAATAAVAFGATLDPAGEPARLLAGAAAGGFLLLAHLVSPRGMGMGDVKLAGLLGLLLGREVAPAMIIALVLAVAAGVAVLTRAEPGARRSAGLPFGPFLAIGALAGLFAGHALLGAYLHLLA
jgi:leader peptidase (prepilin peptidase)/N-methyltransferase